MKENLKNPFGIVNGELCHVKNITRECNIYCPECKDKLILKDGHKMVKHLSHAIKSDNCISESIIHKYIKQYLFEQLECLTIKEHKIIFNGNKLRLSNYENLKIKEKYLEYRGLEVNYIPDIFFILEGNYHVAIEICYKNKKDLNHIESILKNSKVDMVLEIRVTEEDLMEFNEKELIERADTIYNEIGSKYQISKDKTQTIYEENKVYKTEIDEIKSKNTENLLRRITYLNKEINKSNKQNKLLEKQKHEYIRKIKKLEINNQLLREGNIFHKELQEVKEMIGRIYLKINNKNININNEDIDYYKNICREICDEYEDLIKIKNILLGGCVNIAQEIDINNDDSDAEIRLTRLRNNMFDCSSDKYTDAIRLLLRKTELFREKLKIAQDVYYYLNKIRSQKSFANTREKAYKEIDLLKMGYEMVEEVKSLCRNIDEIYMENNRLKSELKYYEVSGIQDRFI